MHSSSANQLLFGPLPQSTYEAPTPITVDTTTHHMQQHRQQQQLNNQHHSNGGSGHYNGHQQQPPRSTIRWNQAGISTSAERRLPFVHRFRGLPPPAGPPTAAPVPYPTKVKSTKMSTYETNPVGALQERFQSRNINPVYQIIQAEGASHCPTFTFQVFIADLMASGSGNSKKQAKHAAARAMLDMLDGKEGSVYHGSASSVTTSPTGPVSIAVAAQVASGQVLPSATEDGLITTNGELRSKSTVRNSDEAPVGNPVGQLQEFCVKHGLPMPVYDLGGVDGQPHQRSFDIVCKVGLVHMKGQGASKKEAKRKAASDLLEQLTEAGSGAHALVFGNDGKEKDEIREEVKLSKAIQDLSLDVQAAKLQDLQRTSLKSRSGDYMQMLTEVGIEQQFEVTYVDIDEKTDEGQVQYLVQLSTLPVAVCYGLGQDQAQAKTDAARNALNYLKVMAKRSNENTSSNSKATSKSNNIDKPKTNQTTAGIQNGVKKT